MGKNMKEKVNIYLCLAKKKSLLNFGWKKKEIKTVEGKAAISSFHEDT